MNRLPHKRPRPGPPPLWDRTVVRLGASILALAAALQVGGALTDDVPTIGELRDGMRFLATRTLPAAPAPVSVATTVTLPPTTLSLDTEVDDGDTTGPDTAGMSGGGAGDAIRPSAAAAAVAAEKAAEMEGFDAGLHGGSEVPGRLHSGGVGDGGAVRPDQSPVVAPCTTIRCQLDARASQQPGGGIDTPEFHAWLTESAAEYRRDRLIHTFEDKTSPLWDPDHPDHDPAYLLGAANRYIDRVTWDRAALAAGWQPEELEQLWRIARYEAPSEIRDLQGDEGPPGQTDLFAIGKGDEACALQISAGYWDEKTAEHVDFPLLFADFQLFALDHCLLAGRYLYEQGGWTHWEAYNRGPGVRIQ